MIITDSKNSRAIRLLAKEFIAIPVDSRIKTITEYSKEINVARGTIQNSLKVLSDNGTIKIKSKGHLGSFLIEKDLTQLLYFADIQFIVGVMPLPYSKRYEGLSTGILKVLEEKLQLPINMSYMRGAKNRINLVLRERYDFAITSKFAAKKYMEQSDDIEIVKEFGCESYVSKHQIITLNKDFTEIKDGMRVGIDYDSIDQSNLTLEATKDRSVELIEVDYNLILDSLRENKIDVAIWNGDEVSEKYNDAILFDIEGYDIDNTIASLIIKKDRYDLKKILSDSLDVEKVLGFQKLVINNKLIPNY